jgi:hypothetical protein
MNINRHNYEEFFLLYVDNELTAGQRKIVDAFVATNPDLQEEFDLIQQATFTADVKLDETFISSLLKPVGEESTISEEQLLLYVDDELSAAEKAAVEKELLTSPSLQKELQWLRRSQVTADTAVVFPDKSLLYKQAEPARVFSMSSTTRKWSAAAAVALLLGSAIWFTFDSNKTIEQPGKVADAKQPTIQKNSTNKSGPAPVKELVKEALEEPNEFGNSTAKTESVQQQSTTKPFIASVDATTKPETTVITSDVPTDPIITEPTEKKVEDPSNYPTSSTVQSIASTNNGSTTVYDEDAANEEEGTLFTEDRQRKSGIAGFLKKAKRTFERKTGIQSSSSEVRFAVFAVNTQ